MIQQYLARSNAGLRFIAQAQLYNNGNFERLREYIDEGYSPASLEEQSADERIQQLQQIHDEIGKIRVMELINADKHRTVMILQTEKAGNYYTRLKVEEDYPHLVTQFILRPHGK